MKRYKENVNKNIESQHWGDKYITKPEKNKFNVTKNGKDIPSITYEYIISLLKLLNKSIIETEYQNQKYITEIKGTNQFQVSKNNKKISPTYEYVQSLIKEILKNND